MLAKSRQVRCHVDEEQLQPDSRLANVIAGLFALGLMIGGEDQFVGLLTNGR
jgi:hypothetical protein